MESWASEGPIINTGLRASPIGFWNLSDVGLAQITLILLLLLSLVSDRRTLLRLKRTISSASSDAGVTTGEQKVQAPEASSELRSPVTVRSLSVQVPAPCSVAVSGFRTKLEKMKGPHREIAAPSKIKFEDSEEESGSSSSSSEDEEEIERELAEVTFEELQKARSDGSHSVFRKKNVEKKTGRANKNRPMEVSCKKPVGIFRETIQVPKKIIRDPRFEDPSGTLDVDGHRKRYNFLYSEKLPAEKEELHKQLKKTSDPKVVNKLKGQLSWIDKQLKSQAGKPTGAAVLADHKKKEREAAKQGKRPYYLKESEIREKTLVEKYNDLKASGKLESFMEKRRRKNAAKDHRFMPYRRPDNEQQSQ